MKLQDNLFKTIKRKYFFTQRVIKLWNLLPEDVVKAVSVAWFKKGLDIAQMGYVIEDGVGLRFVLAKDFYLYERNGGKVV